jgi:hypothetical protein
VFGLVYSAMNMLGIHAVTDVDNGEGNPKTILPGGRKRHIFLVPMRNPVIGIDLSF